LSAISLSRSATSIIIELDGKRECEGATSSTHEHLHNMFRLELSRSQIVGFRRRVGSLDERLPVGPKSLRRAAWAGLQDSMPRAALLSIHARVEGAGPTIWEHHSRRTSEVRTWIVCGRCSSSTGPRRQGER